MDTSTCSVADTYTRSQATCTNTPRNAKGNREVCTPARSKAPRTPRSCSKTPTEGDRFIPAREDDLDIAHFYITQKNETTTSNYAAALEETIFEGRNSKILSFKAKAPTPQIHIQNLHAVYPQSKPHSPKKDNRHIPLHPSRVLDAPGYSDDFYLNILDWGQNNVIAVGLGNAVYLWNAATSSVSMLPPREDFLNPSVTSLTWLTGSNYLAIGTDNNTVQIWDVEKGRKVREMGGHSGRVAALSWSGRILSSGSRDTTIINHDVRIQEHLTATLTQHTQEVCGLKWNGAGSLLASGGNDNMAHIWDVRGYGSSQRGIISSPLSPLYSLPHMGAVKALAWCPFQSTLLATGGGSSDRSIRFFSSSTGGLLNSVDTSTQVCQLLWSTHYKELVSTHGFSDNNLTVWKYPSMQKAAQLTGHRSRVLSIALSPDGETCVSGAADETLRFWHVFERESKSSSHSAKIQKLSCITNKNTMIR